jgi:hypothetical protein
MKAALVLAALCLAGCESRPATAKRGALDEAYLLGAADAVKQLYWAKQALEAPRQTRPAGSTEYYTWQDGGAQGDGRRLAPEIVSVPVFVPAPVPAAPQP